MEFDTPNTELVHSGRSLKKTAATILALGAASATVVFGSFAAWTATTSNPGNSVASGSITLNNSSATAFFTATGAKPGDTGTMDTRTIGTPVGALPQTVSLSKANATAANALSAELQVQIDDTTTGKCIYPASPSPCGASYGPWDSLLTTPVAVTAIGGGANWPAGEDHDITANWKFPSATDNSSQSKTASFELVWTGSAA